MAAERAWVTVAITECAGCGVTTRRLKPSMSYRPGGPAVACHAGLSASRSASVAGLSRFPSTITRRGARKSGIAERTGANGVAPAIAYDTVDSRHRLRRSEERRGGEEWRSRWA